MKRRIYSGWTKTFKYIIKAQILHICHFARDLILNCSLNDWFSNHIWRPFLLRLFGMKCGSGTSIAKCTFIGSLRNIEIGENSMVNMHVFFHAGGRIIMGKNVTVGFQASFITGDHEIGTVEHRCGVLVRKDIVIEDGAWIAARALIGPGVTIGAGSVVSAGAVVMRSMPSNVLIAGIPARIAGKLDDKGSRQD